MSCGKPLAVSVAFSTFALLQRISVFVETIFAYMELDFWCRNLITCVRSVKAESQKIYAPRQLFVKVILVSSAGKLTGTLKNLCKTGIKRLILCAIQNGESDC